MYLNLNYVLFLYELIKLFIDIIYYLLRFFFTYWQNLIFNICIYFIKFIKIIFSTSYNYNLYYLIILFLFYHFAYLYLF